MKKKIYFFFLLIICFLAKTNKSFAQAEFYYDLNISPIGVLICNVENNGRKISCASYPPSAKFWPMVKSVCKDVFVGGKVGWDFPYSPFSVYASLKFSIRNFYLSPDIEMMASYKWTELTDYYNMLFKILPGFGVRIEPKDMLRRVENCPVLQVGADFDCFTLYDTDGYFRKKKGQIAKGINTIYGLGWHFKRNFIIMCDFELPHHNVFDTNFSPDDGFTHPYANLKSRIYQISATITKKF